MLLRRRMQTIGDDNVQQYFSEIGFEVKHIKGLSCPSATAVAISALVIVFMHTTTWASAQSASRNAIHNTIALKNFCSNAQKIIADTHLPVKNIVHNDYDAFVKSKPSNNPLTTHQYFNYKNHNTLDIADIISCKLKTVDSINNANNNPVHGKQKNCKNIIEHIVKQVVSQLDKKKLPITQQQIVIDEDQIALIGPQWLNIENFQAISIDSSGLLHLRAKGMYIPDYWFIPVTKPFKGVHYCHLPNPEYLTAVMNGKLTPLKAD